jgi:hypothetical protein
MRERASRKNLGAGQDKKEKHVKQQTKDPDDILNAHNSTDKELPKNTQLVFLCVAFLLGAVVCVVLTNATDFAYIKTRLRYFCFLLVIVVPLFAYVAYYWNTEQIAPPVQDDQTESASFTIQDMCVNGMTIGFIISWFLLTWTFYVDIYTPSNDWFDWFQLSFLKHILQMSLWVAWSLVCGGWVWCQMSILTKIVKKCTWWLCLALLVVAVALMFWFIANIASDQLTAQAEQTKTETSVRVKAWQETTGRLVSLYEVLPRNCMGQAKTLEDLEPRVSDCTNNFQEVVKKTREIMNGEHLQRALAGQHAFAKAQVYFEDEVNLLKVSSQSVESTFSEVQPVNHLLPCFEQINTVSVMEDCVREWFSTFLTTVMNANAIKASASLLEYVANHRCLGVAYTLFEFGNRRRADEQIIESTKRQITTLSYKYVNAQETCAAGLADLNKNIWGEHLERFRQRVVKMIDWRTQCFASGQMPSPKDVFETLQVDVLDERCQFQSNVNDGNAIATANTTTTSMTVHKLYCKTVKLVQGYTTWNEHTMRSVLKEIQGHQSRITEVVRDHVRSLREDKIKESQQTHEGFIHDIENAQAKTDTRNNTASCMQMHYVCSGALLGPLVKSYYSNVRGDNSAHCKTPDVAQRR